MVLEVGQYGYCMAAVGLRSRRQDRHPGLAQPELVRRANPSSAAFALRGLPGRSSRPEPPFLAEPRAEAPDKIRFSVNVTTPGSTGLSRRLKRNADFQPPTILHSHSGRSDFRLRMRGPYFYAVPTEYPFWAVAPTGLLGKASRSKMRGPRELPVPYFKRTTDAGTRTVDRCARTHDLFRALHDLMPRATVGFDFSRDVTGES